MFTAAHFIEKTKFMAKQMDFAFPHCYFGKSVSGQNQVVVYTVVLSHCLGLYKPYLLSYCLTPCIVDFCVPLLRQAMKLLYGESDLQDPYHQKTTQKKLDKLSCLQWDLNLYLTF